ncbi:unnamed protein product [Choristocarpus tenellus]
MDPMRIWEAGGLSSGQGARMQQNAHPRELGIMDVVRGGDFDGTKRFVEAGGNVNSYDSATERTLLHTASRQGYTELVSLLLSHGAIAGAYTLRRLTPLHLAAYRGHLEVARLLVEAWAPVDDRDMAGSTPLHLATIKGHGDVARLLLQCGANIDGLEGQGWTALHFACWKGYTDIVRLFLLHRADMEVRIPQDSVTPLHLACIWGHREVTRLLLSFGANASSRNATGDLPEHLIGTGFGLRIDAVSARELGEMIVGHRARLRGGPELTPLQHLVESLRVKVSELEEQLQRQWREKLELMSYARDEDHLIFSAALRPDCIMCGMRTKEAVLHPCQHLTSCCDCAVDLSRCPFCGCAVESFLFLENSMSAQRLKDKEEELAGVRHQLEHFENRIRSLVATNSELKLELSHAKVQLDVVPEGDLRLGDRGWDSIHRGSVNLQDIEHPGKLSRTSSNISSSTNPSPAQLERLISRHSRNYSKTSKGQSAQLEDQKEGDGMEEEKNLPEMKRQGGTGVDLRGESSLNLRF